MKKILALMLVLVLTLGCVFTLASCKKDDEDDKPTVPNADPEKVLNYFLEAGFEADYYSADSEFVSGMGIDGLAGVLQAETDEADTEKLEVMFIFYFESEDARKAAESKIDTYFARLGGQATDLGLQIETGKDGKMAWLGTPNAVKIASGVKVNIGGGANVGGDVVVPVPCDDANAALEALLDKGYMAEITTNEDYIANIGIPGLIAVLEAEIEDQDGYNAIFIYYFESEEALNSSKNAVLGRFDLLKESAESEGIEVITGTSGFIAWMGTERAITDTQP